MLEQKQMPWTWSLLIGLPKTCFGGENKSHMIFFQSKDKVERNGRRSETRLDAEWRNDTGCLDAERWMQTRNTYSKTCFFFLVTLFQFFHFFVFFFLSVLPLLFFTFLNVILVSFLFFFMFHTSRVLGWGECRWHLPHRTFRCTSTRDNARTHLSLSFSPSIKDPKLFNKITLPNSSVWRKCGWGQGLFTVGFFVWSTSHCTVCPARWLVSSSSVCNPSSDPFVKSHRSPSSFTPCNIFWAISLPKTEQKDHFSCQFFKISNPQSDGCGGITWPSFTFSILSYHILSLLKIWSRYHE